MVMRKAVFWDMLTYNQQKVKKNLVTDSAQCDQSKK